jgi:hypothetical protein
MLHLTYPDSFPIAYADWELPTDCLASSGARLDLRIHIASILSHDRFNLQPGGDTAPTIIRDESHRRVDVASAVIDLRLVKGT